MKPATTVSELLGDLLRVLREDAGRTQGAIANHLGIRQASWSKTERGLTSVSVLAVYRVAPLLRTTPADIFSKLETLMSRANVLGIEVLHHQPDPARGMVGISREARLNIVREWLAESGKVHRERR